MNRFLFPSQLCHLNSPVPNPISPSLPLPSVPTTWDLSYHRNMVTECHQYFILFPFQALIIPVFFLLPFPLLPFSLQPASQSLRTDFQFATFCDLVGINLICAIFLALKTYSNKAECRALILIRLWRIIYFTTAIVPLGLQMQIQISSFNQKLPIHVQK